MNNNIVYIDVNEISPHPDNPRKELGDLTELADSIKANGIMQNLTVVPQKPGYCNSCNLYVRGVGKCAEGYDETQRPPCSKWKCDGRYTVVIGHRRLAAAKKAGITKVPCVVAEMDEKTQISTMLLENMQRSDLTVIEQAQGFQLMLDLGETTHTISEKTGFSETTVRKRLFVASLNTEKSKNAYERGATLEDYMKLQQITNEKKRDKVLESLGTNNFGFNLGNAIAEELRDRVAPKIIKQIEAFATPTDKPSWELRGYGHYCMCRYEDYEKKGKLGITIPKKWESDEYLYNTTVRGIEIFKKREDVKVEKKMSELSPAEQEERREKRRKYKALKEMGETTYQLRLDFVTQFSQKSTLNAAQLEALSKFAFASVCLGDRLDFAHFASLEGLQVEKNPWQYNYSQKKELLQQAKSPAAKILLVALYSTLRDNSENTYFHGPETAAEKRGYHKENAKLSAIYDCICALGYQMSDEEQALRNGTHELFLKDEGDNSDDE